MLDCYKYLEHSVGDFPNGYDCSKKILSLPMFPELKQSEVVFVSQKIKEFYS